MRSARRELKAGFRRFGVPSKIRRKALVHRLLRRRAAWCGVTVRSGSCRHFYSHAGRQAGVEQYHPMTGFGWDARRCVQSAGSAEPKASDSFLGLQKSWGALRRSRIPDVFKQEWSQRDLSSVRSRRRSLGHRAVPTAASKAWAAHRPPDRNPALPAHARSRQIRFLFGRKIDATTAIRGLP